MYAFGARDFDGGRRAGRMVKGANRIGDRDKGHRQISTPSGPATPTTSSSGYVPGDPATTLEYGLANFGIAQLATAARPEATYPETFMKRSHGLVETIYNPTERLDPAASFGARLSLVPFDPADSGWYVEGNGAQYHWMTTPTPRRPVQRHGRAGQGGEAARHVLQSLNAGPQRAVRLPRQRARRCSPRGCPPGPASRTRPRTWFARGT